MGLRGGRPKLGLTSRGAWLWLGEVSGPGGGGETETSVRGRGRLGDCFVGEEWKVFRARLMREYWSVTRRDDTEVLADI